MIHLEKIKISDQIIKLLIDTGHSEIARNYIDRNEYGIQVLLNLGDITLAYKWCLEIKSVSIKYEEFYKAMKKECMFIIQSRWNNQRY